MPAIASNLVNGRKVYTDQNGAPLAGASVFYYVPGTFDLSTVYLDDQQMTVATNPIVLDAAGSCVAFAVGEFREYVLDADNNLISDTVVVGFTPLTVSAAMLPVLEAATVAEAEALLVASGAAQTDLQINPGDQTLNVSPTANPPNTRASFSVQGTTLNPDSREFLVNFGLTSSVGSGGAAGNDKVCLYAGIDAQAGTSDVWSLNTVLTQDAGSGDYNAQGYELDFNNLNVARGNNGNLISDYTAPVSNGLSISGVGGLSSTTGCFINSPNMQWSRGLTTAGTSQICGYQEWTTAPVGHQFDGAYSIAAINLVSLYGNAGAVTNTAMFMKAGQALSWQSASTTEVISDILDSANNRYVGLSSGTAPGIILCGNTIPQVPGLLLGSSTNPWGDATVANVRLPNAGALTWSNNPATAGGLVDLIVDYTDTNNNRVVGTNSSIVFMGAPTAPQTINFDLGTATNTWGNVYSSVGIVTPSDLSLKEDVRPINHCLEHVEQIEPICFTWKDGRDEKFHVGFDANDIREELSEEFGGYKEANGLGHLCKEELIGVLWQAVRELSERVKKLEE